MRANSSKTKSIAVLISGTGRTLDNLNQKIKEAKLQVDIAVVIASKQNIKGIEIAKKHNNKVEIVDRRNYSNIYEFSRKVFDILNDYKVDLVVLAGWIQKLWIPKEYEWKVINIHPALLPLFGGFRYYGEFVHRAVIESGAKVSGCTVHYVTSDYDSGPIILQDYVKVEGSDTAHTLGERVFEKEKELLPRAIEVVLNQNFIKMR